MSERIYTEAKTIRLIFLGSYETDRRIKSFARFFFRNGFHVEIVFGEPGKNESRRWIDGDIMITQLPIQRRSGPMMFIEYRRKLNKHLLSLPHSCVTFACDLYSLFAARKEKTQLRTKKVIYDARELYTELPTVESKPFVKLFWKTSEKRGLIVTDRIVVTAPLDVDAVKTVHSFLPYSVLVRNLPEASEEFVKSNYLRKRFSEIGIRKILVYAGGIQHERGLEEMIEAMKELQREYVFVIIGTGSLRSSLQEEVLSNGLQQSVYFHEPVHSDKLLPILASADIGVVLIKTDSGSYDLALPSKVFEYMQAGLPILSSKMKQVNTLFPDEEWIHFVDISTNGIVRGISKLSFLSDDTVIRQNLSQKANSRYIFDVDAHTLLPFLNT